MSKANYSLRLQPSLKAAARTLALAEGTSDGAGDEMYLDGDALA